MKKVTNTITLSTLLLSGALTIPGLAQSNQNSQTPPSPSSDPAAASTGTAMSPNDSATYATGKPLETQSKEGFWGHVNPFARKKWVNRQITPIKDRTNELDQLQSKNRNDIHDVDSRAQAGISKANSAAALADQHAQDAGNRANTANTLAGTASSRTDALHGTVSNLDQYQEISSTTVPFVAGHTALGKTAKADLDDVATKLSNEKGYIVEVQGYSRSGVQTSQAMADSVVRYLVTEHQIPVYRIYKSGLGKNTVKAAADGEKPLTNGVRVTLLHNSLATMDNATANNSTTRSQQTGTTGTSTPPSNQ